MNTTTILTRPGLRPRLLVICALSLSALRSEAIIITTNCPDVSASIAQPKRVQGNCPALGPLNFYFVTSQTSTGGFNHVFGGQGYYGIGRGDTNGLLNWKIALTNGNVTLGNAAGRFGALQDLPSGSSNISCFGVYDRSGSSFVPVFEKQLPFNNHTLVSLTVLSNSTYVIALNRTNSVTLLALNSAGVLLWAKQLTSADFPHVDTGDPSDPGQSVDVVQSGTNSFLLTVGAVEDVSGTNTAKTAIVRLDASGTVQWARKFSIPLSSFNGPSSSGPIVFTTPAGDALLIQLDFDLVGFEFVSFTYLAQIATNGNLAWSREFVGGGYLSGPLQVNSQGSLLLGLSSGLTDPNPRGTCCILTTNGQVTSLLQVNTPLGGIISPQAVSLSAGKVYFAGNSGSTPVIASSSLLLTGFSAKEYSKGPLDYQNVTRLEDERLVFLGAETNGTTTHLVILNSNLVEQATCGFFTASSITTSNSTISVVTNTPAFATITVSSSTPTVSLVTTQLQFQTIGFQEDSLCGSVAATQPTLLFNRLPNQLVLSWPTSATGFNLQFSTNLATTNWGVGPSPVISGSQYTVTNQTIGSAKFFRLKKP